MQLSSYFNLLCVGVVLIKKTEKRLLATPLSLWPFILVSFLLFSCSVAGKHGKIEISLSLDVVQSGTPWFSHLDRGVMCSLHSDHPVRRTPRPKSTRKCRASTWKYCNILIYLSIHPSIHSSTYQDTDYDFHSYVKLVIQHLKYASRFKKCKKMT